MCPKITGETQVRERTVLSIDVGIRNLSYCVAKVRASLAPPGWPGSVLPRDHRSVRLELEGFGASKLQLRLDVTVLEWKRVDAGAPKATDGSKPTLFDEIDAMVSGGHIAELQRLVREHGVDLAIIEQQVPRIGFGGRGGGGGAQSNIRAFAVAHVLWSHLRSAFGTDLELDSVSANAGPGTYTTLQVQTDYVAAGYPQTDLRREKKRWAIRVMDCTLQLQGRPVWLSVTFAAGGDKRDDLADSFLQILSWYRTRGKNDLRRSLGLCSVKRSRAVAADVAAAGLDDVTGEDEAVEKKPKRARAVAADPADILAARIVPSRRPFPDIPNHCDTAAEALVAVLPKGRICCYLVCPPADVPKGSPRTYKGYTVDMGHRLRQHAGELAGGARATSAWKGARLCLTVDGFENKNQAMRFEKMWKITNPGRRSVSPRMPELFAEGAHLSNIGRAADKLLATLHSHHFATWPLRVVWWLGPGNQLPPQLPREATWAAFQPRVRAKAPTSGAGDAAEAADEDATNTLARSDDEGSTGQTGAIVE